MSSAFEREQISEDCNSHFNNVTQNTPYPVCHDMQVETTLNFKPYNMIMQLHILNLKLSMKTVS